MPLYDYKCQSCGKVAEVRHGFNEAYTEPCAACGAKLMRVFNPAPIVFKGSGFYVTDSRKGRSASTQTTPDAAKGDAPKSEPPKNGESAPAASSEKAPAKGDAKSSESAA